MTQSICYAVVDRAIEPSLLDKVDECDSQAWCLFPAPVEEDYAQVAPYLIVVNEAIQSWLTTQATPWGYIFFSTEKSQAVRAHLRSLMDVVVAPNSDRLFLRYYDPRLLWTLLDSLGNVQLNHFLGPMQSIQTSFPQSRKSDFAQKRAPFLPFGYVTQHPFPLTAIQYQQLLQQCELNLIADVATILGITHEQGLENFSQGLVTQLLDWEISTPNYIKMVAHWCAVENITTWMDVPESWTQMLADTQSPASYRIASLQAKIRSAHVM